MVAPEGRERRAPKFKSLEEEAAFWDTQSPLDYPNEWTEEKPAKIERPLGHILAVRLDAQTIHRLAVIARKKGIGPSTLARMWLLERLAQMDTHPTHERVDATTR